MLTLLSSCPLSRRAMSSFFTRILFPVGHAMLPTSCFFYNKHRTPLETLLLDPSVVNPELFSPDSDPSFRSFRIRILWTSPIKLLEFFFFTWYFSIKHLAERFIRLVNTYLVPYLSGYTRTLVGKQCCRIEFLGGPQWEKANEKKI